MLLPAKTPLLLIAAILLFSSCGSKAKTDNTASIPIVNSSPPEIKKEALLPEDFSYKVIEDRSNPGVSKNELTVEINKKITAEQLATLAKKLYLTKDRQRRFYMFYLLPGMKNGAGAWATSHYDPELEVEILGSTAEQDMKKDKLSGQIKGIIIGKWKEEQYTSSSYILFKEGGKIILRTIFRTGQVSDEEMKTRKVNNGSRYDYKDGGYNGEYFILNRNGELEFYNSGNKRFTTAAPMNE